MNNPQPYRDYRPIAYAIVAGVIFIGGILAWLIWQWTAGMFYLLYGAVALTVAAGVARLWAHVLVYLRRHAPKRLDTIDDERMELARRSQGLPVGIQTLNYHDSHRALPAPPPPIIDVEQVSSPPSVPNFSQLLDQGSIGPGRQLILAYRAEDGQALTGSWSDLYSCGVGALQGAGKTWVQAFLLTQSAAAGGRLIICDPNPNTTESLSTRVAALAPAFMCDVATEDDEILNALRLANDKLERRKRGQGGDWPIIVAVDEWSSLLRGRLGDELPGLVQNISEQGRKYNVNCILSAQGWTVAAAGIVRNRLTAHYVLRQRDQEARYQLGLRAAQMPNDIPGLPDATAYLLPSRGTLTKVRIPHMTAADIARAGAMIDKPVAAGVSFGFTLPTAPLQPIVASGKSNGSQMEVKPELTSTAAPSAKVASPEAARAAGLFLAGKSPQEIAAEMRGVKSSAGGRAYQTTLSEIYNLIREGLQS